MIIRAQTIDATNQHRYFSWSFVDLELTFDVLNEIISTGAQLITVELLDKGRRAYLPAGLADEGELLFVAEVHQLECDWQQLLGVPTDQ